MKGHKNSQYLKRILVRYVNQQATKAEMELLEAIEQNFDIASDAFGNLPATQKQEIRDRMEARLRAFSQRRTKPFQRSWIRYAAAILIVGFIGSIGYWYTINMISPKTLSSRFGEDIRPGTNKAMLTLANGEVFDLSDQNEGIVMAKQTVTYQNGSPLRNDNQPIDLPPNGMNVLSTPKGGQYQLTLADGTKVWLNAGSTLKYPAQFEPNRRYVELTGEAYFEVAKQADQGNHIPFYIKAFDQTIEVLGTQFNVKAYGDETIHETSLKEGSVRVATADRTIILEPGQQARMDQESNTLQVRSVSRQEIDSWRQGYFSFQGAGVESIMNDLARWYNVDIVYQTAIRDIRYEGSVSRFENISEVLEVLELTGGYHFKIDGRRVIIMP